MSTPSPQAVAKFRHVSDPDDARDLAFDYDADDRAQYDDYAEMCREMGEEPLPFKGAPLGGNPIKRTEP